MELLGVEVEGDP